jgi:hypothetical protein
MKIFFNKKSKAIFSTMIFCSTLLSSNVLAKSMPKKAPKKIEQKKDFYTSLIVNCKGLSLGKSMSPVLLDVKYNELYPSIYSKYMSTLDVMEGKVIKYEKDLDFAKASAIAGKKPLIIKPIDLEGLFKSNPVITREDSIKLRLADFDGKFLKDKKVIFVY